MSTHRTYTICSVYFFQPFQFTIIITTYLEIEKQNKTLSNNFEEIHEIDVSHITFCARVALDLATPGGKFSTKLAPLPSLSSCVILKAMKEVQEFMTKDGKPLKDHQKLLRNLRVKL